MNAGATLILTKEVQESFFDGWCWKFVFRRSNLKTLKENDMLLLCRKGLSNLEKFQHFQPVILLCLRQFHDIISQKWVSNLQSFKTFLRRHLGKVFHHSSNYVRPYVVVVFSGAVLWDLTSYTMALVLLSRSLFTFNLSKQYWVKSNLLLLRWPLQSNSNSCWINLDFHYDCFSLVEKWYPTHGLLGLLLGMHSHCSCPVQISPQIGKLTEL